LGEYSEAVENYTKAIELYPSYFEVYNNRGVCFTFLGEYDKACFDFNPAGNPPSIRAGIRAMSGGLSYIRKTTGQVKLESEDTTSVRAWSFIKVCE